MQPQAPVDAAQHELHDDETGRLSLQQLPNAVLELIVVALKHQAHQQALRCTCSAMRAVVDGLIDRLNVDHNFALVVHVPGGEQAACKTFIKTIKKQLQCFPAHAVVRRLTLGCIHEEEEPILVLSSLMPSALLEFEPRFSTLQHVTLSGQVVRAGGAWHVPPALWVKALHHQD